MFKSLISRRVSVFFRATSLLFLWFFLNNCVFLVLLLFLCSCARRLIYGTVCLNSSCLYSWFCNRCRTSSNTFYLWSSCSILLLFGLSLIFRFFNSSSRLRSCSSDSFRYRRLGDSFRYGSLSDSFTFVLLSDGFRCRRLGDIFT